MPVLSFQLRFSGGPSRPPLQPKDVDGYLAKTGFPDLTAVSTRIEKHVCDALDQAASEANAKVMYGLYDKLCSVGRRLALPGSDMDFCKVMIDGPKQQEFAFLQKVNALLDPDLVAFPVLYSVSLYQRLQDALRLCHMTLTQMKKHGETVQARFLEYFCDTYFQLGFLPQFLRDRLPDEIKSGLQNSVFFQDLKQSRRSQCETPLDTKLKHDARKPLVELFPNLSLEEQTCVINIMRYPGIDGSPPPGLLKTPHVQPSKIQASLQEKGLLVSLQNVSDHYIAPWRPSHYDEILLEQLNQQQTSSLG